MVDGTSLRTIFPGNFQDSLWEWISWFLWEWEQACEVLGICLAAFGILSVALIGILSLASPGTTRRTRLLGMPLTVWVWFWVPALGEGTLVNHAFIHYNFSSYEPVGNRDEAERALEVERLTGRRGGSHLLAHPIVSQKPTTAEETDDLAMMQRMGSVEVRWTHYQQEMQPGLHRLWRHPFVARHFGQSAELKGWPCHLNMDSIRFRDFVHPLGEIRWILTQSVESVDGGPPLHDMILYQDEHSYRLPFMIQVITGDGILQGSVLWEHKHEPVSVNARDLFAL